jgi:hypothetical protein
MSLLHNYTRQIIIRTIGLTMLVFYLGGCSSEPAGPAHDGPLPIIIEITPSSGTTGTEITITGTGFRSSVSVYLGTLKADNVEVDNGTVIYAFVPAGVDSGAQYDVTVRNTDGTDAKRNAAFTVVGPTIRYVNGATKPSGNLGSTVIIEGNAFGDVQGTGTVLFSDGSGGTIVAAIASPADWTNTFIVTTVPSGAATGNLVVTNSTGTSNALPFTVTETATFSPSVINWSQTSALPQVLSGHSAVFFPVETQNSTANYVHVAGGIGSLNEPQSDVYYAMLQPTGQLGAWQYSTSLPVPRAFHTAVVASPYNSRVNNDGYIYILGGISEVNGQPVSTVYRAAIQSDGNLGNWSTATQFPRPIHSAGAVIFRSWLYVAGGATNDHQPVASVYRARIDSLGLVGEWEELASLPSARAYHQFASFGGYLYAVGGDNSAVHPNDGNYTNNDSKLDQVVYARINLRTGELSESGWQVNSNTLTKRTSKHTSLMAGGNVLNTGGLYSGAHTGSSENSYAQVNSDGSVGQFQGATGSNTILSQGGGNLFNHAAISYVDANGVARVMVLGGDDVNNNGNRRNAVWYY